MSRHFTGYYVVSTAAKMLLVLLFLLIFWDNTFSNLIIWSVQ